MLYPASAIGEEGKKERERERERNNMVIMIIVHLLASHCLGDDVN